MSDSLGLYQVIPGFDKPLGLLGISWQIFVVLGGMGCTCFGYTQHLPWREGGGVLGYGRGWITLSIKPWQSQSHFGY